MDISWTKMAHKQTLIHKDIIVHYACFHFNCLDIRMATPNDLNFAPSNTNIVVLQLLATPSSMCSCKWPRRMIPGYFPTLRYYNPPLQRCVMLLLLRTSGLLASITLGILTRGFKMWGPLRNIIHQPWNTGIHTLANQYLLYRNVREYFGIQLFRALLIKCKLTQGF